MEYGKPRARRLSRGGARRSGTALLRFAALCGAVAIACAVSAASLSSCGAAYEKLRAAAYASSLSSIDATLASSTIRGLDAAFSRAFMNAGTVSDWLCLLKRARIAEERGDAGRYAATADRALRAFPKSDPIAAASAHAYLRNGHPRKALALFGVAMSADARPALWAEAFLSSMSAPGFTAKASDYGRLADISGDPRPFLGAALSSLAEGDKPAAEAWLEKALAGGASVPPELLWDCGLYEILANRSDAASGSAEIALMGDAAWMSGDVELAKRRWTRSIALGPKASWKPYSNLALLSRSRSELASSYWERMRSAFLSAPPSPEREGALGSYAAYLAREGKDSEALAVLKGGMPPFSGASGRLSVLALAISGRSMPEERYAAQLERLAALRPDDPEVMGAALKALSIRGMYGEVAVLREGAARRKLSLEYGWYYEAEVLAARGDYAGAVTAIQKGIGMSERFSDGAEEGAIALGGLFAAMGDPVKSAAEFSRAVAAARNGQAKCAALKALGRELGATDDKAGAERAYRDALAADPGDAEAALLARSVAGK